MNGMTGVTIRPIGHINETWVSFPEDLGKPLEAEYFYSQTPFTVRVEMDSSGIASSVISGTETVQQRIVGRVDLRSPMRIPMSARPSCRSGHC